MALWGKSDGIYSPGTVVVDLANKTITGTGTSFRSSGITTGTVISVGAGGTFGEAVVSAITSETVISIATTQFLLNTTISGVAYTMSQKPMYVMQDSNYSPSSTSSTNKVFGVDQYEAQNAVTTKYAVTHAGWVGIKTYNDTDGNLRVKSETLVAFSGITTGTPSYASAGDAADDTNFVDFVITIAGVTASPSASVGVGTTVTLTVSASSSPDTVLSYQWQKSTAPNGSTYSNISGATGISTSIANPTNGNNNYNYRVVVSATGANSVTSSATKLIVTP
jgi:hypothetical protein